MNTRFHSRSVRLAVAGTLAAFAVACGPFHRGTDGPATVDFTNQATSVVQVWATGQGQNPVQIGTVPAGATYTLTVPSNIVLEGPVNITARFNKQPSGVPGSGPIVMHANDHMRLRLSGDEKTLVVVK